MSNRILDDLPAIPAQVPNPQPTTTRRPVAVPLGSLQRPMGDDPDELLKHRYLCRGAGLLLVGPTGVGKSSLSMQCMLRWAIGEDAFDIQPTGPLKSLLIQAENDDGDLTEMRDGVVRGLELSRDDREEAVGNILVCRDNSHSGPQFFANTVRPLLEEHRPDLLWIDPALAYIGGEANSQEAVGLFLRNHLNPLLDEFRCASIVVHHTNKPMKTDGHAPNSSDLAYLGAGSAEWANWSRAVLALRSTPSHGVYALHAAKRGTRLGWWDEDQGSRVFSKHIAHALGNGEIYWRPATLDEIQSTTKTKGKDGGTNLKGMVLTSIPTMGSISKAALVEKIQGHGFGRDKVTRTIKTLIESGQLQEVRVERPRVRPEVHISHAPQNLTQGCTTSPSGKPPTPPPLPPLNPDDDPVI